MADLTSQQTRLRNESGSTRIFEYIPYHGKELADNEAYAFDGNIFAILSGNRNKRKLAALKADLLSGAIRIISLPSPILFDSVQGITQEVGLASGTLNTSDPSWGHESSSA